MVEIFITDSKDKYIASTHAHKILYQEGFIGECNFHDNMKIEAFNSSLVGLDDDACRLMLMQLDSDTTAIKNLDLEFDTNKFIAIQPADQKIHSTLFNFYRQFIYKKYLFQLVLDRFFSYLKIPASPIILFLSEDHYLVQELPYTINSCLFYSKVKGTYIKLVARQIYYRLFAKERKRQKTQVALFLYDIHNEFDVFGKFIELVKKDNKLAVTIVVIDSGNPTIKKVDTQNV